MNFRTAMIFGGVLLWCFAACRTAAADEPIPLDQAVREGKVWVYVSSLGGSTGNTVCVNVKRMIGREVRVSVTPGTIFRPVEVDVQGMAAASVQGVFVGGQWQKADVMAAAGTKCVECHELKKGAQTVLSVKAKCVECHNDKYGKMLLSWKEEITAKENAIAVSLDEAKGLVARNRKAGKNVEAEQLVNQHFTCKGPGSGQARGAKLPFGCYQVLGNLRLVFPGPSSATVTNYRRQLNLAEAVARLHYSQDGITFTREVFVSAPDEAIVACVARMFGSEQIVFGTDYPFGLGQEGKQYTEHAIGVVQESGLSETDLAKIYGGNARQLLQIDQL